MSKRGQSCEFGAHVRWDRSFRVLGWPAWKRPGDCVAGARGSGPRGEGCPALLGAQFLAKRWWWWGRQEAVWHPVPAAQPARGVEAGGPPWPLAPSPCAAPARAPLPFQGLFRAEPWESVSPVEVISLESARRGCKSIPTPLAALRSRGGGSRTPGAPGPARGHPRPAAAAGSAASGAAAGVKGSESINQPTPPSPNPRALPAGPA